MTAPAADWDPDDLDHETLVRDVASLFNTYVGQGLRIDTFVDKVHPSLDINDLTELLELYFILTDDRIRAGDSDPLPGVLSFVDDLSYRLRRLKRTVGKNTTVTEDAVRGPIDWSATVSARARRPTDATRVFAYDEPSRRYDIPENRVLKQLLVVINRIVRTRILDVVDGDKRETFTWATPWTEHAARRDDLYEALEENPYLAQVSNTRERLPHTDIDHSLHSRSSLYREAAELLRYYRRLQRHEIYSEEAEQLLRQFFLSPGGESSRIGSDGLEVLYEFYWAFKLLTRVPSPRLELVRQTAFTGEIARWINGNGQYTLYHDTKSPGGISFGATDRNAAEPPTEPAVVDFYTQQRRLNRAFDEFFASISQSNPRDTTEIKQRRPDIVVTRRDSTSDDLTHVFLGEVKYSKRQDTIEKGVRQLLQAAATVQVDGEYLSGSGELFQGPQIQAGLFVVQSPFAADRYPDGLSVYEYGDDVSVSLEPSAETAGSTSTP